MKNLHLQVIEDFYSGFAAGNSLTMRSCYHPEVLFQDPVFGKLEGTDAKDMWEMLTQKSQGNLKIRFSHLKATDSVGSADWKAYYTFSSTNRSVINAIHAEFEFKEGLIYRHKDSYDLYAWSKQALGLKGVLYGWTPFFKKKIQQQALQSLRSFQRNKKEFN
jgi:hypothetical protein